LRQFTQDFLEMFRGMVICKVVDDPAEMLDLVGDELKELKALAEDTSLEDLQRIVTLLMKTQSELVHSSYPLLTLEMSLVRLATLSPSQDLGKLIAHIESLEKRLASSPLPKTTSALPPPPEPPPAKKPEAPVATETDSKGWQGLVERVKQERPMLGSVLEHGSLLKLEPPALEIGFPKGSFMINQLQEADVARDLEAIATEYFGQAIKIKVSGTDEKQKPAPPSLAQKRQAKETDRMRRLKSDALEHPALKQVQDIFDGKVEKIIPIDKGFV
jgi:DNA polymerase-3 subunit gamma/tau